MHGQADRQRLTSCLWWRDLRVVGLFSVDAAEVIRVTRDQSKWCLVIKGGALSVWIDHSEDCM